MSLYEKSRKKLPNRFLSTFLHNFFPAEKIAQKFGQHTFVIFHKTSQTTIAQSAKNSPNLVTLISKHFA
jgi:hypothetical protein